MPSENDIQLCVDKDTLLFFNQSTGKKKKYIYIYQDVQIPGQRELQQQYVGQLVLSSLTVPAPSQESSAKKTIAQVWIGLLVLVIRDKLCPNL